MFQWEMHIHVAEKRYMYHIVKFGSFAMQVHIHYQQSTIEECICMR